MKTLNLVQGTSAWLAVRLNHFTASEASIMMGASPYMTREELLTMKKTGITAEVNDQQQRIFDRGHDLEKLALPIAEQILGKDLYPVTGVAEVEGLPLLASFDGLDMLEEFGFEHKTFSAAKVCEMQDSGNILPEYMWQLEHQLLVSGAQSILFVMSDGTESSLFQMSYESVPERRAQLIAGWKQFAADLATHEPKEYAPAPEAKAILQLPALHISLVGQVRSSNLIEYKQTALTFVESINTTLETDQDFADAEKTIKFCDSAEKELEVVKKAALSQTADIDLLFRTVDELRDAMKAKRLELDRLVKARKEAIRVQIVTTSGAKLQMHIDCLTKGLSHGIRLPPITADFAGAIKGKKTIKSLEESANEELARAKVEASQTAERYRLNLSALDDFANERRFLFNDLQSIISKPADDFELLVVSRVNKHKADEAERLAVETKRIEEATEARLRIEANAKAVLEAADKAASEAAQRAVAAAKPVVEMKSEPFAGGTLTRSVQVTPEPAQSKATESLSSVPTTHEGDIMNWLYSEQRIYGEQGHQIARALMSGRVPHMKYVDMAEAKAA